MLDNKCAHQWRLVINAASGQSATYACTECPEVVTDQAVMQYEILQTLKRMEFFLGRIAKK